MTLAQARTTEPAMADNLANPVATMKSDGRTRKRHAILTAVQRKSAAAITLALPSGRYSEDLSITNWTTETLLRLLSFVITVSMGSHRLRHIDDVADGASRGRWTKDGGSGLHPPGRFRHGHFPEAYILATIA